MIPERGDALNDLEAGSWEASAMLGWGGLALPERLGGSGQSLANAVIVAIEVGRRASPLPLAPTILAGLAVAPPSAEEQSEAVLAVAETIANGRAVVAWADAELGAESNTMKTHAVSTPDGWVLTGTKSPIEHALDADSLIVSADVDGTTELFIVPRNASGAEVRQLSTLDLSRQWCGVGLDHALLAPEARISASPEHVLRVRAAAAILASADAVGAASALLEMTVSYAKERHQFGQPIGSFQAVQHKCANMRIWLQASTVAAYYAAMVYDSQEAGFAQAAAVAKSAASRFLTSLAGEALQIHGGIGMSWESDVHLLLRRIRVAALLFGSAAYHHEQYAKDFLSRVQFSESQ